MRPCKTCGEMLISMWIFEANAYCTKHAPAQSKRRLLCKEVGCISTNKYRADDGKYCRIHTPINAKHACKCSAETCITIGSFTDSGKLYCKKHKPDGCARINGCHMCGANASFVANGKKYCTGHAPSDALPKDKCCVETCKKWRTHRSDTGGYCKTHAPSDAVSLSGRTSRIETVLKVRCNQFIKSGDNCFVFSCLTYDVVVEKTSAEYIPLPWNRPTTVILYQKADYEELCDAINKECQNFSGEIIRLL
jgi:hypothetical protein